MVFVPKGLSTLSKTDEKACALISEEYLFIGLRKGCGFFGLHEKANSTVNISQSISKNNKNLVSFPRVHSRI